MYLAHFGLSEAPFRITPHTEFFFEGANRGATLEALLYAVTHDEGIVKVSGEVGSGKTMLCRVLLERLPAPVATIYLANPSLGRDEILLTIAEELKVDTSGKRTTVLLRALQDRLIQLYAQGRRVVVLIDEAHAMPAETLEEIRLLSNLESNRHKLLQIILFGQPELDEHLNLPNMRQLRERITHSFRLEPLVRSDVDSYVDFRMRAAGYKGPSVFSKAALKRIAEVSEGLTRRVNILADKSLLAAFADNTHAVTTKHVRAAASDSGYRRMRPLRPRWRLAAGTLAVGLLLGFAVHYLLPSERIVGGVPGASAPAKAAAPTAGPAPGADAPKPTGLIGPGPNGAGGAAASQSAQGPPSGSSAAGSSGPAASIHPSAAGIAIAPATPARDAQRPGAAVSVATTGAGRSGMPAPSATSASAERRLQASLAQPGIPSGQPGALPVAELHAPGQTTEEGPRPMGGPFRTPFAQERFAAASAWMAAAPDQAFTIQLMTARDTDIDWVENFLARAQQLANSDELYVYSWPLDNGHGYRVAYGLYETLWACRDAITALPESLKRFQPYPEKIAVVRKLSGMETSGIAQR